MEVDLLDFVEQCRRLVKQALGKHAGEPASGGFARWKHVVLHCLRLEDGHSYRETPNRLLKYMAEIRDALGLDPDDLPDYSTIYKSFDRLKMWVWRALLRVSAQQHPQSEHAALDSTFFDRRRASSYFRQRAGRTIQTLKVTTLTDVESLAVLDVHIAARWKHDTKTGPQVVRRNADDLQSVAADNGFKTGTPSTRSPHTTSITSFIIAARQRTQPRKTLSTGQRLLSAVDGRNIVFDNEALARRRRASAGLVSTVP